MRKLEFAQVLAFDNMQELPTLLREMAGALEVLMAAGRSPVAVNVQFATEGDEFGWDGLLIVE